jgi:hypothetical protein
VWTGFSIFIRVLYRMQNLFANKSTTWILLFSAITIIWWFAIWTVVEDTLVLVSGGKRHIHVALCVAIIAAISIGFYGYPELLEKL